MATPRGRYSKQRLSWCFWRGLGNRGGQQPKTLRTGYWQQGLADAWTTAENAACAIAPDPNVYLSDNAEKNADDAASDPAMPTWTPPFPTAKVASAGHLGTADNTINVQWRRVSIGISV